MVTKIEASNYRCLKYISQDLRPFQILVGPNASGKTTFLDVVNFIADIVNKDINYAIAKRAASIEELTWAGQGGDIELAIECELPFDIRGQLGESEKMDSIRYELKIGIYPTKEEYAILGERVVLFAKEQLGLVSQLEINFPIEQFKKDKILNKKISNNKNNYRQVLSKNFEGNDNFYPETHSGSKGWLPSFKLGYKKSSLANLPADESKFPASTWLKTFLEANIQTLVLNSQKIRELSRPGLGRNFLPDGSNLPWVVDHLKNNLKTSFEDWIYHIRTALPDVKDIEVKENLDTKSKYLKIIYDNGIEVPSWTASDGTLRLLALTLIAYLPDFTGIFLIEEPENGIHPKVMEAVYQSLSSVYDAQILLATHSPVILSIAKLEDILCFAKTPEGVTDIVPGDAHPMLKGWQGGTNLSILYASGVLG